MESVLLLGVHKWQKPKHSAGLFDLLSNAVIHELFVTSFCLIFFDAMLLTHSEEYFAIIILSIYQHIPQDGFILSVRL